jgi:hypothetical protein
MIEVENKLLEVVRTAIINAAIASEHEVDIEIDDLAPAVAGDFYMAISVDSASVGNPQGETMGSLLLGVRVAFYQRITHVPRDRRRSIFSSLLGDMNTKLGKVIDLLHKNWDITCQINAMSGINGRFVSPLTLQRIDNKPRTVDASHFASKHSGAGEPVAAILRGIGFGGADFRRNM